MEDTKHEGAKVYIYTRVSTAMQVDGYSLDAQKDEIMRYVQYKNMHVCGEYTDEGKSGKSIQGRPGFQKMMDDIVEKKDGISFVICFKLSRFGRNTADILNSLKMMKRYGANLICVKENIDSSLDSGKMMISILGAMAEIERDNISVQTMAGRREKARQGGWNGATAPYGYRLVDGNLIVDPAAAEHVRLIYDKYINTNMGRIGVTKWMNTHGYKKILTTHNSKDVFIEAFIDDVLKNPVYYGKIAFGRRTTVLREGSEDQYHMVETDDFMVCDGHHEPIISEETWDKAQRKKQAMATKRDYDKEHHYVYSGLVKCPLCGSSLYGVPSRGKRRKTDGTLYPPYYAYACRHIEPSTGVKCSYGQISCEAIDNAMFSIISGIVDSENFGDIMGDLVSKDLDSKEMELELDSAIKSQRQALGLQRKLESELDKLDVSDKHYDRKYESISRRLDDAFDAIEEAEKKVADCEKRLESIKKQGLTRDSVYEALRMFDKVYMKMTDSERKAFVKTFIESIELNPVKKGKSAFPIKSVNFRFPVSYDGKVVYTFSPPLATTDETVVVLGRQRIDSHISVDLDVKQLGLKSSTATYDDIKAYVREKYGFEVHSAYIGQVKEKFGIRERKNYNVGSGKRPMPSCPPEKEEAIMDAFKHFKMI